MRLIGPPLLVTIFKLARFTVEDLQGICEQRETIVLEIPADMAEKLLRLINEKGPYGCNRETVRQLLLSATAAGVPDGTTEANARIAMQPSSAYGQQAMASRPSNEGHIATNGRPVGGYEPEPEGPDDEYLLGKSGAVEKQPTMVVEE